MKKIKLLLLICILTVLTNTSYSEPHSEEKGNISDDIVNAILLNKSKLSSTDNLRFKKGVVQAQKLWNEGDGSDEDFQSFVQDNFYSEGPKLDTLFEKVQRNLEIIKGHFNKMMLDIKMPVALEWGEITDLDRMFDSYDPSSHLESDLYKNKIAFTVLLNFPYFSLEEKRANEDKWSRKEWAYARLGDLFTSRVKSKLLQDFAKVNSEADAYIYEYYIYMGNIVDDKGNHPFPKEMKLITHWNLRDELKSQYSNDKEGLKKQKLIYSIMQRIITQEIPQKFINSNEYEWNPITNVLSQNSNVIEFESEPNTRYQKILNQFEVLKEIDDYSPSMSTYIQRKFTGEMEMSIDEVESLFVSFVSSPTVKKVASLIKNRLGRDLQPFDIWYDGFKSRSSINEEDLNKITKKRYPNPEAVKKDLPNILTKFGWTKERAKYITDKIEVDPSRGAGHAWGAVMKGVSARLRTKIAPDGMDYKGYNIAVHEVGHNVEQTLSLYDIDYYMLNGVPNTAFTEALAFVFQMRDLELLGMDSKDPNKHNLYVLDNFWSTYEIMGASLVDQKTWMWLYENPNATKVELNIAVNKISKEIWNKYYAPVFGLENSNILGVYSHMISYPLYLSAYPIGHLIEFQIEQYIRGKNLGTEFERMAKIGRLTPNKWMREATGKNITTDPLIKETEKALEQIKK
ncbi:MAG: hypothetical protein CVV25_14280 [Ignavibacteriae bacterium HGW-Ignavibacteriae-4]|nr:MAG: hypothetical protein CVV25_14280 [Ignavibacteriae bacterium HGW-Ignavibacteriae-4]